MGGNFFINVFPNNNNFNNFGGYNNFNNNSQLSYR